MNTALALNVPAGVLHGGSARLKSSLLGAVGLSIMLMGGALADDPPLPPTYEGLCALVTDTVTCTGIQPAEGVDIGDLGVTQLNIHDLTAGIVPPSGTAGVVLDTTSAASANIDLGSYAIVAAGGGDGIYISAHGPELSPTNASLMLTGDVGSDGGRGVVVTGSGSAASDSTGNIESLGDALTVKAWGGAATVDHYGNLTSLEGRGIYAEGQGNDIDITGDIDSLGDGIYSHSWQQGSTSVVVGGDITSREGSGVVVEEGTGTALVDVTGTIAAHVDGINVTAIGDVTVDQSGQLTTDSGTGIYARSSAGGVSITHDGGSFRAHGDAIVGDAHEAGESVVITSATDITSDTGRGIVATTSDGTVDLNLSGKTTAKLDAITAEANGGGALAVDIDSNGNIVSYDGRGVYAYTTGAGISADGKTFGIRLDQDGDVTSKLDAITAIATNSSIYLDVDGNVTSYDGNAITASSANGLIDLLVDGTVTSKLDAVTVTADNGDLKLDFDNVTSYDGSGIVASARNGNVDLGIGGSITTGLGAITLRTENGYIDIGVIGGVTSYDGTGIDASSANGPVDVAVGGSVTTELDAIKLRTESGDIGVDVTGDVTSYKGNAIAATSANGALDVTVGGSVTGELGAIKLQTDSGDIALDVTGDVTAGAGKGIDVSADNGAIDVAVGGDVTAGLDAIVAQADSAGIDIDVTGNVTSNDGNGISASSEVATVDILVGGDVTAKLDAITAHSGGAALTVDVTGDVTSYDGNGIAADTLYGSVDVDIGGDVTAKLDAVTAQASDGTATVDVRDVTSYDGLGIKATSTNGAVSVTAGDVAAKLDAVTATTPSGTVTVDVGGVTSYDGKGITATTTMGGVSVTADDVTAKGDAVVATTPNGAVSVNVGDVTSYDGLGIKATTTAGAASITAGDVTSELDALYVSSTNAGVKATAGDVTSYSGKGVVAWTLSTGNAEIETGSVTSELDALYAYTTSGSAKITTGTVIANNGKGIVAWANNSGAAEISVGTTGNALDVTTQLDAIYATARNGVTVLAGDVTSYEGLGVFGLSYNSGVTFTLGDVSSEGDAIYAEAANGAVNITGGDVSSESGAGVVGLSDKNSVTFSLGDVTTELDGVYADAKSQVSVTAGNIDAESGTGIFGRSLTSGVTFNLGDVEAGEGAIYAEAGNGAANVTAGDVTSKAGTGVFAQSPRGLVDVSVGNVTAYVDGIFGEAGVGKIEIDAGAIIATTGRGVFAKTLNGVVDVSVGSVSSGLDGIYAESAGASSGGSVTVEAAGSVTAANGRGIFAMAETGPVSVTVDSGSEQIASDVEAELDAVTAQAKDGAVDVDIAGDVTSHSGKGVTAITLNGSSRVDIGGDVTAKLDAVTVTSNSGNSSDVASLDIGGSVLSQSGRGVSVTSVTGPLDVSIGGGVTSQLDAIYLKSNSSSTGNALTLDVGGSILSNAGKAIIATSDNGAVTIGVDGSITSKLDAVFAQSLSGDSSIPVTIDIGGGVTSWDGRAIEALAANGGVGVTVDGAIVSKGDAISAKSTGDGLASIVTVTTAAGITSYDGRGIVAESANRGVTVDSTGAVTTGLSGIVARSTGAGITASVEVTQTGKLTSYQGTGIDALSTGGPVTVSVIGGIEADLDGIVARSLGDDNVAKVSVTGSGGNIVAYNGTGIIAASTRDGVTVNHTGDIFGFNDGIYAESTGNTGTSQVVVTQTGAISLGAGTGRGIYVAALADGEISFDGSITGGTYGIHATSLQGAIEATIAGGSTVTSSSMLGVYLAAETSATLTNRGTLSSPSGTAFEFAGVGTGTVNNYGTITGDFAFKGGAGTFNNYAGGTYQAATLMDLGGGTFQNGGVLSFTTGSADSAIQTTVLNGNIVQSDGGTYRADIRLLDGASDRLQVSGSASLAGTVAVNVLEINGGIKKDFTILSAATGQLSMGPLTLSNPVLHGDFVNEADTDAILRITDIDFGPEGISERTADTGDYVQEVFKSGAPEVLWPLLAELMSTPDVETYENALDQLDPEQYTQEVANTSVASLSFANRLLSCRVSDGPNRFKAEGECDWFGMRLSVLDQDQTDDITAFSQTFATLEAGTQKRLDDNWRIGGAVGITNSVLSAADGSGVEANQAQAGVVVKYDADALLLASSLTAGYGIHQNDRHVQIGLFDETLSGEAPIAYLSARFHTAYTFDMGAAYIKPLFNLDLSATHFGGVTETGGGAALTIDAGTQYSASFNPAIEFGGEIADESGKLIRPFLQVGLEASLASDLDLAARFSGVAPAVGSMTLSPPDAEPVAKLSVGADVLTEDKATIRVYYDGSFGASSRKNGLGLKMSGTID